MSDETDATSEVARVLGEHQYYVPQGQHPDGILPDDVEWECAGCGDDIGADDVMEERHVAHMAQVLAEAGLLRDAETDRLATEARDAWAYLATQGVRPERAEVWFGPAGGDMTKQPALPNWTLADMHRLVDEAFERGDYRDLRTQQAQIATQEPAGATRGGSGDSRVPGGLDGAPVDPLDISALLSQVARLEQDKDQWRDSANTAETELREASRVIVRVRALAQWFRGQGQTGYAWKVEEALDGTAPEPVSENPFRMPEDRA